MPDTTQTAMNKLAASPFATVTGPLGFGGLFLFWQLQGISGEVRDASQDQAELQLKVGELTSAVNSLTDKADAAAGRADSQRADLNELRARVTRLEAEAAAKKKR